MAEFVDISDAELHAFIDGALDAARRARFEERMERDPALAVRVAAYRLDKEMLKTVFGPLSAQPVPQEWLALTDSKSWPRTSSWKWAASIAAALAIVVLGTITYQSLQQSRPAGIVEAALDARAGHGGVEVQVTPGADVRQYDQVLSNVVKLSFKVPNMQRMGFRLTGIRLFRQVASAELQYRDHDNALLTVYLRQSDGVPRFYQFPRDGLRVCVWQDNEIGAVMAGNISTAAMQRLAALAFYGT